MNRQFFFAALLLFAGFCEVRAFPGSDVIPPWGKYNSRFLIVVDRSSFNAVKEEILQYKSTLESEGLGTAVLVGEWDNPERLRDEIMDIYNQKPAMEGAVFIGKIPVVRVQNFQHATTAFKMDEEKYPISDASVTSDRYYDDLDLQFDYVKRDEKDTAIFYYRLRESSPQVIISDFYSSRMLPPSDMGEDTQVLLKKYLKKVVAAHREYNPLDMSVIFNGHGYNSDCLTAWQNEQFAIREQIPAAFKSSEGNGFYNFRQDPFMKYKLFDKLQQAGTDLFVFHEHGDFDTQYINGDYPAPNMLEYPSGNVTGPMTAMAVSLRNTYRRYSGEKAEKFRQEMIMEHGLSDEFFNMQKLDSLRESDSIFSADLNIVLKELIHVRAQPWFVVFDACYNGSFHQPGYVAGYYVFGEGNTIVAQGNTVNVLQDKWSLELLGMLTQGARIGFWQREFQYLESHLIGDPTYRFSSGWSDRMNADLAGKVNKRGLWLKYLKKDNPNFQSLAIKQLSKNPPAGFTGQLLTIFRNSKYCTVRMEALKRLLDFGGGDMVEAIRTGLDDPYEMIRRVSARYAGYSGDPVLIPPLVSTVLFSNESRRVQYAAQGSLEMFDIGAVISEIERESPDSEEITGFYKKREAAQQRSLSAIMNRSAKPEERVSAVRSLRNYNNHKQVDSLLLVLKDRDEDPDLRIKLAEALGWFGLSVRKPEITGALYTVFTDNSAPRNLKDEAHQSLIRLGFKAGQ